MNGAKSGIVEAFRHLALSKPYAAITVSDICLEAHLSRKSFYVHFQNKEDVFSYIFTIDAVKPLRDINVLFTKSQARDMYQVIYQKPYQGVYDNKEFYSALVGPMKGHDDTFIRIATNAICDFNLELLAKHKMQGDIRKVDYIAYFFASSQAMLIQKWICDGFPYTPEEMASLYNEMTQAFWISSFADLKI